MADGVQMLNRKTVANSPLHSYSNTYTGRRERVCASASQPACHTYSHIQSHTVCARESSSRESNWCRAATYSRTTARAWREARERQWTLSFLPQSAQFCKRFTIGTRETRERLRTCNISQNVVERLARGSRTLVSLKNRLNILPIGSKRAREARERLARASLVTGVILFLSFLIYDHSGFIMNKPSVLPNNSATN
jgi:hypothetical protein